MCWERFLFNPGEVGLRGNQLTTWHYLNLSNLPSTLALVPPCEAITENGSLLHSDVYLQFS